MGVALLLLGAAWWLGRAPEDERAADSVPAAIPPRDVATPSDPPPVPTSALPLWVANPNLLDVTGVGSGQAVLAVGTEGTILRSTDDGKSFERVPSATREYLSHVLVERETGAILVVGSGGIVLRSTDAGQSFERVAVAEPRVITAVAQSAESGAVVFVGDEGMAYSSADGGRDFRKETTPRRDLLALLVAVDGARGRFVAAGADGALLVREKDGTWHSRDAAEGKYVTALRAVPGGIVLVGLQDGRILRSADEGERFHEVRKGVEDHYAVGFDVSPGGEVVAARVRREALLVSHDRGGSFTRTSFDGSTGAAPLAWTDTGFLGWSERGEIVRSDTRGERWKASAGGLRARTSKLAVFPGTATVVAVGASGFVGRLPRAGPAQAVRPDLGGLIRALAVDSVRDVVVGAGLDETLVASRDGGRTYERRPLSLPREAEVSALLVDPQSGTWYVATTGGHVLASRDGGEHFSVASELEHPVHAVLATQRGVVVLGQGFGLARADDVGGFHSLDVARGSTLRYGIVVDSSVFVVGDRGAVFRSGDGGASFARVATPTDVALRGASFDAAGGRLYVVGDRGTLLVSTNLAVTFEKVPLPSEENLFCVGTSADGATVFVGGNAGTLLRSDDHGASFAAVPTGSTQPVRVAAFDRRSGQFVVAGVGGLLMTTEDGKVPRRFPGNFEGRFDQVAFHEASGGIVVAGDRLLRFEWP